MSSSVSAVATVNHDWDQEEYDILAEVLFDPQVEASFSVLPETPAMSTVVVSPKAAASPKKKASSSMEIQNAKLSSGSTLVTGSLTMMPDTHLASTKATTTKRPVSKPASPRSVAQHSSHSAASSSLSSVATKKQKIHASLPPKVTKTVSIPSKSHTTKQTHASASSPASSTGVKPHPRSKALQQFLKAVSVAAQQEKEQRQQKHLQQSSSSASSNATSAASSASPTTSTTSSSSAISPQEQMSVRRERNRFLAKQTRERKKVQLQHLRHEFEYFAKEHARLTLLAKNHLPESQCQSLQQHSSIPKIPTQVWDDAAGVQRPPEAQQRGQHPHPLLDDLLDMDGEHGEEDTSVTLGSNNNQNTDNNNNSNHTPSVPEVAPKKKNAVVVNAAPEETPTVISSSSASSTTSSNSTKQATAVTKAVEQVNEPTAATVPMEEVEAILSSLPDEDMMLSLGNDEDHNDTAQDPSDSIKELSSMTNDHGLSMDIALEEEAEDDHSPVVPEETQMTTSLATTAPSTVNEVPLTHVVSEPNIPEMEMAEFSIPNPLAALSAISDDTTTPAAPASTTIKKTQTQASPGPRLFGKPVALKSS